MKDVKKEAEQTLAAIGIHAICSATIRSEHPERVSFSKQRQPSASSSGHEINLLTGAIALTRSEYAAGSWRGPCPDLAETLPGSGRQGASNAFGVETPRAGIGRPCRQSAVGRALETTTFQGAEFWLLVVE